VHYWEDLSRLQDLVHLDIAGVKVLVVIFIRIDFLVSLAYSFSDLLLEHLVKSVELVLSGLA
jgi:hypothetical protein